MNPNYMHDKEIIMRTYRESINEINSILTSSLIDRKLPSVIISIVSDYAQNLIESILLRNFNDFWEHVEMSCFQCLSCGSKQTVLFRHGIDTLCKFGHVEIAFQIGTYSLYFGHSLFRNDSGDQIIVGQTRRPPLEDQVKYEPEIWKYMQNIDKMWLTDGEYIITRYLKKQVD